MECDLNRMGRFKYYAAAISVLLSISGALPSGHILNNRIWKALTSADGHLLNSRNLHRSVGERSPAFS